MTAHSDQPVIVVSACLLGYRCRYNAVIARGRDLDSTAQLVPVCPEVLGGLSTPRPAASIDPGFDGGDVLDGEAGVTTEHGVDVTAEFLTGARRALEVARESGAGHAILKTRSPSCGFGELSREDGSRTPGNGVFADLLLRSGFTIEGADFEPVGSRAGRDGGVSS